MSKYKIIRIDDPDPELFGKRRRRLNIVFAVVAFLSAPLLIIVHELLNIGLAETNLMLMIVVGGFFLIYNRKLKQENNNFRTIGDIEFSRTSIIKRIGDSYTENSYESIESINLQKHIPALSISESKSGFYTYILSLNFKNNQSEKIIVSDRPSGKWKDLSITETIKTLQKITSVNIKIT